MKLSDKNRFITCDITYNSTVKLRSNKKNERNENRNERRKGVKRVGKETRDLFEIAANDKKSIFSLNFFWREFGICRKMGNPEIASRVLCIRSMVYRFCERHLRNALFPLSIRMSGAPETRYSNDCFVIEA